MSEAKVTGALELNKRPAFDPKATAPTFDARVHLTGGEQLFGKLEGFSEESLRLRTPWPETLREIEPALTLEEIQHFMHGGHKAAPQR